MLYSLTFSKENRKKMQNIFLLALSTADTLYCSIYSSYKLSSLIDPKVTIQYEISCKIMTFLVYTLFVNGIMVLTALSLDRYLAVKHPFGYTRRVNTYVISLTNFIAYIYPAICFCPLLFVDEWVACFGEFGDPSGIKWQAIPFTYVSLSILLLFILPAIILIFTNIYVFIIARRQYLKSEKNQRQTRKSLGFNSIKLNQVSDTSSIQLPQNMSHLLNASIKNSRDKSNTNDFKDTVSSESIALRQNISTTATYSYDSEDMIHQQPPSASYVNSGEKLKTTYLKNAIPCRNGAKSLNQWSENTAKTEITTPEKSLGIGKYSRRYKKQLRHQNMQQDWKIATMTVALVIGFFITCSPFIISRMVAVFNRENATSTVDYYADAFTTVNSVINPYLVLVTRNDIRRFLLTKA